MAVVLFDIVKYTFDERPLLVENPFLVAFMVVAHCRFHCIIIKSAMILGADKACSYVVVEILHCCLFSLPQQFDASLPLLRHCRGLVWGNMVSL